MPFSVVQSSAEHCNFQSSRNISKIRQYIKFLFQNILNTLSLHITDTRPFFTDLVSYSLFNTELCYKRQLILSCLKKYFFNKIKPEHILIIISGKSALLDSIIQCNCL